MIIVTVASYSTSWLRYFITLRQFYDGKVITFLTSPIDNDYKIKLEKLLNIEIVCVTVDASFYLNTGKGMNCQRWGYLKEVCLKNPDEFIIFTDHWDVIWQADPRDYIKEYSKIHIADENWKNKENAIQMGWFSVSSKVNRAFIEDKPVYNCGTVGGLGSKLIELCDVIVNLKYDTYIDQTEMCAFVYDNPDKFMVTPNLFMTLIKNEGQVVKGEFSDKNNNRWCCVHANGDSKQLLEPLYPKLKYEIIENKIKKGIDNPLRDVVGVEICTRGRTNDTLPNTLISISQQTFKPDFVLILDDNEQALDAKSPLLNYTLRLLEEKGIGHKILSTGGKGQVAGHEAARINMPADLVWRIDDDEFAEPNCLKILFEKMQDKQVGAAAGCVCEPNPKVFPDIFKPAVKLAEIKNYPNIQWFKHVKKDPIEVEHLYSSFLYRRVFSSNYPSLSRIGHREETIFSHTFTTKGLKLFVCPDAMTYHFRMPYGGIRDCSHQEWWASDEQKFTEYLKSKNVVLNEPPIVVSLICGAGDNIVFRNKMSEFMSKYRNRKVFIATAWRMAWEGIEKEYPVELIPLEYASALCPNLEALNPYVFMSKQHANWQEYVRNGNKFWDCYYEIYNFPKQSSKTPKIEFTPLGKTILVQTIPQKLPSGKNNPKYWDYFKQLIALLKYQGWNTVQVGSDATENLDCHTFHKNLNYNQILELLCSSTTWISVDSMLQHMADRIKKPGIVIWSRSSPKLFGYDYNHNILVDEKYLRTDQYGIWENCEYHAEAFPRYEKILELINDNRS